MGRLKDSQSKIELATKMILEGHSREEVAIYLKCSVSWINRVCRGVGNRTFSGGDYGNKEPGESSVIDGERLPDRIARLTKWFREREGCFQSNDLD